MAERTYKCPECYGYGIDDDLADGKCAPCLGTGRLTEAELRSEFPDFVAQPIIDRANIAARPTSPSEASPPADADTKAEGR